MRTALALAMVLVALPAAAQESSAGPSSEPRTTGATSASEHGEPTAGEVADHDDAATEEPGGDAGASADADAGAAGDETSVDAAPQWNDDRVIAWATFATSLGVAILGGVLLAVGVDDVNTIENAPDGTAWPDVAGARDRAPVLTGVGSVVLGLGAAGMAVGAALLAHFGAQGTWLEVSALPGGVRLSGRF